MPPSYVKPYLKRQKNDMADAEAICEAVTRPTVRFVPVKSPEQQGVMVLHRTRLVMTRQRTQPLQRDPGHMAEFGLTAAIGREGRGKLISVILDCADERVTREARVCLTMLVDQLRLVNVQILDNGLLIRTNARATEAGRRLMEIPGAGPLLASAMVVAVADPATFKTGRNLTAWIAWSLDRTPAAARSGSAALPSRAIDNWDSCWWSAHWPSFVTRNATARVGRGWYNCWRAERRRSRRSRSPTRTPG